MSGGMFRLPDQAALDAMLKRSHCRVVRPMKDPEATAKKVADKPLPKKPAPKKNKGSYLEAILAENLYVLKVDGWVRQHQFDQTRKWSFDFAWPELMFAVEVEGMVHRIKSKFKTDIIKHANAQMQGWTILRVGGDEVRSGTAITWIEHMLKEKTK